MASWIDDFTAVVGSVEKAAVGVAGVVDKAQNLINPTATTAPIGPTTTAPTAQTSTATAQAETKTKLPDNSGLLIVAAVVVGLFLLMEW